MLRILHGLILNKYFFQLFVKLNLLDNKVCLLELQPSYDAGIFYFNVYSFPIFL